MYTKIKFPNIDKLIFFENHLNSLGLLHNYTTNYQQFTFEKKDISEEIKACAAKYEGVIIRESIT